MTFRASRFVRFMAAGRQVGWLNPELAARLRAWPAVFTSSPDKVALLDPQKLRSVVEELAKDGFIPGWRDERYRIDDLFEIERAAARPFGLTTRAVHVNGISADGKMWLARRATTKAIDPGLLDNLVGGGVASGLTPEQTLVKEAWEEAGIPAGLARSARRGGSVKVLREVPEGVQSEVIDVYNLALPPAFAPQNQDGEVAQFSLLSFDEVRACGEMTHEAKLVALDYLRPSAR
jgi:8-oxo-dGTP pyrophosphatase MutT (NUDIX family)